MRVRAIVFLDQGQHAAGLEVAHCRDSRIVRPIEGVIEITQLEDGHVLDVAAPAYGGMMVRQRHIRRRRHLLHQYVVRIVLAALVFVAHHGHFRLTVRLVQPQLAHAIGLDGNIALEVLLADGGEVIGTVHARAGVELTAYALQILLDAVALGIVEGIAALEHHVLKDVRRARHAGHFVARAHAVGDFEGQHRRGMVGNEQHRQAVMVQSILVDSAERLDMREAVRSGVGRRQGFGCPGGCCAGGCGSGGCGSGGRGTRGRRAGLGGARERRQGSRCNHCAAMTQIIGWSIHA